MRILTFLHSFEPGGVEKIALRLVRQWRSVGVDAPLFMGRADGAMRHDVGADLAFVSPRRLPIGVAGIETIWMILTLPRAVRRLAPDVLFCAGNTYSIVAVALKLILGRKCPPIVAKISNCVERRDKPIWFRAAYGFWLRLQGRFIDHFVAMEGMAVDNIRARMGVPRDTVTVIPNPVLSEALIARLRAKPRAPATAACGRNFVAVGRLVAQKNIALMLRAFSRAAGAEDRLTLIGDGPERTRLEALAKRLGLGNRVEFKGYVPEPAGMLPGFDALLLSSDYEGVPAVLLEALAADLPIVATDCSSSISPLLKDGALGEIVRVGDETTLAEAIGRVRASGRNSGLSLAEARRFTVEEAGEAYLRVFRAARRPSENFREDCGTRAAVPSS